MSLYKAATIAAVIGMLGTGLLEPAPDYERRPAPPPPHNPPPNPKADKRKANRVKQMQERKQRRKAMSGRLALRSTGGE